MADSPNLQIKDYFQLDAQEQKYWLAKIGESDWRASKYFFQLLSKGEFKKLCGHKSTDQKGLYENFGFSFLQTATDINGDQALIYQMKIDCKNYSDIIGKTVKGNNNKYCIILV